MQYQLFNNLNGYSLPQLMVRVILFTVVVLTGCQTAPVTSLPVPPSPEPEPVVAPEPEVFKIEAIPLVTDIKSVIELMQNGDADHAANSLRIMMLNDGSTAVMESLLKQLETDTKDLWGNDFYEVTVVAGDTLSGLAQQHLGDSLQFYSLAQYNDISVPRLLEVGQQLKIPRRGANGFSAQPSELEKIGTYLIASGDNDAAWKSLLQAADSGELSVSGQQSLFDLSMSMADSFISSGQPELAAKTLEDTAARFDIGTYHTDLQARLVRVKALLLQKTTSGVQQ